MVVTTTRRSRALASAIKQLRERSGMKSRELSERLGLSHSTISNWENGKRIPSVEDVASFLGAVGVNGEERERILNLARNAMEPNWLTVGMPGVPDQLAGVVDCERDAEVITQWAPSLIPGILQTPTHMRASLKAAESLSANEVESRVFVRMGRREILDEGRGIHVNALLGEQALTVPVTSPAATIEQLRYLQQMADSPLLTLRIIRSNAEWHPGLHGPFILYEFPDSDPVVYFEHYSSGAFVQDQKDVSAYRHVINRINALAMNEGESREFTDQLISEMEKA